eukprot:6453500-Amphidinium_carterae.1
MFRAMKACVEDWKPRRSCNEWTDQSGDKQQPPKHIKKRKGKLGAKPIVTYVLTSFSWGRVRSGFDNWVGLMRRYGCCPFAMADQSACTGRSSLNFESL